MGLKVLLLRRIMWRRRRREGKVAEDSPSTKKTELSGSYIGACWRSENAQNGQVLMGILKPCR